LASGLFPLDGKPQPAAADILYVADILRIARSRSPLRGLMEEESKHDQFGG
jgi:hypothetical protein